MGFAAVALLTGSTWLQASVTNRWSFDNAAGVAPAGTAITDSVGGQTAFVRGIGASFTSGALTLPGTTNGNQRPSTIAAYIDLPNGIISTKTNLTVEMWATPISHKSFQRLFDFGQISTAGDGLGWAGEITGSGNYLPKATQSSDALTLTLSRTTLNEQFFAGLLNGKTTQDGTGLLRFVDTNLPTNASVQYHYLMTFEDGVGAFGATGGRQSWYRDGSLIASLDVGFRLDQIEDVNNWLGRSLWSNDGNANAAYDEVRIHNHAFSASEVVASRMLGPNLPVPTGLPDSVTMHPGQKSTITVLANDTGAVSLVIAQGPQSGTATVTPSGRILYTHTTGTLIPDSFTYQISNVFGQSAPITVSINFSDSLRIANSTLNVPATPPPLLFQAVEAFPNLAFTGPTCMRTPPGDTRRLFVCTKGGVLSVIPDVTAAIPTASTVLTLSATTGGLFNGRLPAESLSTSSETGLLGLAFHPDFTTNGFIYVFYSVFVSGGLYERVSRITLNNPTSAAPTANLASERILIQQFDELSNHNGGDLHFGPDGYLYISLGDEGGQNDQGFNGQRIDKDFFSGILRIDVDLEADEIAGGNAADPDDANLPPNAHASTPLYGGKPAYEIPADNPFVGATTFNGLTVNPANVRSEFWAVGLRNPWRFSFDGNDLWCGDVGGIAREEINLITRGGNYGWIYREGTIEGPYASSTPPHDPPPVGFTSTGPIYEYSRGSGSFQGNSVTGGFVYRGTRVPSLTGAYVFADYVSGNVWSLARNGANPPTITRLLGKGGIVAFAPDPSNGDVLIADHNGNRLLRMITQGTDTTTFPATLGATNLFADLADLSPNPGLLPYDVKLPFWSDHAEKRRWFIIPDAVSNMNWSREGSWTYPTGQIWVKHFDMPLIRSNPPQPGDSPTPSKRIETRILVKNDAGSYGVSYRWNEAGTEATLAPDEGVDFDINLTRSGSPYAQRWRIPSRAECSSCHTPQAGHSLSMNTRQLNLTHSINGFSGNQLDLLKNGGYFSNTPESPNVLPVHIAPDDENFPVEARVRSYLEVNCSYCHKAGGTAAPAAWDGRIELTLEQTGLINGAATNNGGDPANQLVVPGDLTHSVALNRVAGANGFTRMPPLGSNELDSANIALLTRWIQQSLPGRTTYPRWREAKFQSAVSSEGEPGEDPDGDGRNNQDEYLAGTEPLSGGSVFQASHSRTNNLWSITVPVPANRSMQVETSENLADWSRWNVPGNHGLPQNAGAVTLQGSVTDGPNFFRVKIQEN